VTGGKKKKKRKAKCVVYFFQSLFIKHEPKMIQVGFLK